MRPSDLLMVDHRAVITRHDVVRWAAFIACIVVVIGWFADVPMQRMADQLCGVVLTAFILCGVARDKARFL